MFGEDRTARDGPGQGGERRQPRRRRDAALHHQRHAGRGAAEGHPGGCTGPRHTPHTGTSMSRHEKTGTSAWERFSFLLELIGAGVGGGGQGVSGNWTGVSRIV